MNDETILKVVGIAALAGICIYALSKGLDGAVIGAVGAIIGGVLGYSLKPTSPTPEGVKS